MWSCCCRWHGDRPTACVICSLPVAVVGLQRGLHHSSPENAQFAFCTEGQLTRCSTKSRHLGDASCNRRVEGHERSPGHYNYMIAPALCYN